MTTDTKKSNIASTLRIILIPLLIIAVIVGRRWNISSHHPYKDMDVVGEWYYYYSVLMDKDTNVTREDEGRYIPEMYVDSSITLNDDGTFQMTIETVSFTGKWKPTEAYESVLEVSYDVTECNGMLLNNYIVYDKADDLLFTCMTPVTAPAELRHLFKPDEEYINLVYRTNRPISLSYSGSNDSDDEDDDGYWDDDLDIPFGWKPG